MSFFTLHFMLKALIIDDEFHARENLRMLLEEFCPEVEVVGDADGVKKGLEMVQKHDPDVVFLDIRMPSGAEGFEFLEAIEKPDFQVVFVTAFKDYAIRAFNANAVHYVLKPIDIDDLRMAVEKLGMYREAFIEDTSNKDIYLESIRRLSQDLKDHRRSGRFTVYHSKGFKVIQEEEIVRLEGEGTHTRLYFKNGDRFLDSRNLKVYEDILNEHTFCRIHKSHIINLLELSEFSHQDGNTAILKDGTELPVARARMSSFLSAVKSLG